MQHLRMNVIGEDRTGVIAAFTNFLFQHGGNIVDLDQAARQGLFKMTVRAEFKPAGFKRPDMEEELVKLGKSIGMDVTFHREMRQDRQRIVALVTLEPHCINQLLLDYASPRSKGKIVAILANHHALKPLAESHHIPFRYVGGPDQKKNEQKILRWLDFYRADLVVLAKYMRVLSPDVVWRFEQRMINIHHSLLPAFPGGQAYRQAFEKGVKLAGCTAHYVTTDLDQGPIIWQESFRIAPEMKLKDVMNKGFELESKCLSKAVKLHLNGSLSVHWGKVYGS
jgi:formyltetrahydrofolate deformylase